MAQDRTAEEALQYNITMMGEQLGRQYSALWQGVALLFANWQEFVELFGTKPERVELLNRAAPGSSEWFRASFGTRFCSELHA